MGNREWATADLASSCPQSEAAAGNPEVNARVETRAGFPLPLTLRGNDGGERGSDLV
jgi:hypothetical protein